jgi:hypothetical protein
MKAKLLKSMVVAGELIAAGEIVDVSGWRNAKSLESLRYIAFVTESSEKPKAVKVKEEIVEISVS